MANSNTATTCPACDAENKVGARFCRQCGAQIAAAAAAYDRAKWQALVQYDPDISAAADTVRPFGQMWVDELGASYMVLNDKSYLPGIVEKVTARAKAEKQRQTEIHEAAAEKANQERQRQAEIQAAAAERAREYELERQQARERRKAQLEAWRQSVWGTKRRKILTASILVTTIVAAILAVIFWPASPLFKEQPVAESSGTASDDSQQSSSATTVYTTRFVNLRSAPTSIGTTVLGSIQGDQSVSGSWVNGSDGTTRWLKVRQHDGSYGYIWGNNLSSKKPVYTDDIVWKNTGNNQYHSVEELISGMQASGASEAATDFAKKLSAARNNIASWAVEYHHYGQVDLVLFDQSIGYEGGFVIVNGQPDMIVNPTISDASLRISGSSFFSDHPNAFQLRYGGFMKSMSIPNGGVRLVFLTLVGECEACGPEATFEYAYDFDQNGQLLQTPVLGIFPANLRPQLSDPIHP